MAIARIQAKSGENHGGVTTCDVAYDPSVTAQSLLVAAVLSSTADDTITLGIADPNNGAWSSADTQYDANIQTRLALFYVPNAAAGATTVRVTASSTVSDLTLAILEASGAALSSVLDGVAAGGSRYALPPNTIDPGTLVTTAAGSWVVAAAAWGYGVATAGSPPPLIAGTDFTEDIDQAVTNRFLSIQDRVAGAADTQSTAWDASRQAGAWHALAASFLAAGGAPAATEQVTLTLAGLA